MRLLHQTSSHAPSRFQVAYIVPTSYQTDTMQRWGERIHSIGRLDATHDTHDRCASLSPPEYRDKREREPTGDNTRADEGQKFIYSRIDTVG